MVVFSKLGRLVSVYVNRNQRCTRYLLHKSTPYGNAIHEQKSSDACKSYMQGMQVVYVHTECIHACLTAHGVKTC